MRRRQSAVALANQHVRIEQAARWAGVEVPDIDAGDSVKVYCPFGELYHPDGGAEPAMRVYPGSNSAWCFACSEYYSPVRICAVAWGQTFDQVAVELLRRVGYKPASYAQHWQSAVAAPENPGREDAARALDVWLTTLPGWDQLQYSEGVSVFLARCKGLLPMCRTGEDCRQWLEGAKQVMESACREYGRAS